MEIRVRCIQSNQAKFINPHDGQVVANAFALFEGRNGEAFKFNLPKEELDKLTVGQEYIIEVSYKEGANLLLPH